MNNFKTAKKMLALTLALIIAFSGISVYAAELVPVEENSSEIELAHEHIFSNWKITKQPTCKDSGLKTKKCVYSGCNASVTESVDPMANSHVPGTETVIRDVTCNTNGITEYECASCGETYRVETEKLGHLFPTDAEGKEVWNIIIQPQHMEKHYKDGIANSTCVRCNLGVDKTIPVEHNFDGETSNVILAPTCTTPGYKETMCTICQYKIREDIPAEPLAHVYKGKVDIIGEFNCKTDGKGIVVCEECNEITEITVPKELAHDYIEWEVQEPLPDDATCDNGLRGFEVKYCPSCTDFYEERYTYGKHCFEHFNEKGELVSTVIAKVASTCTEPGYELGNCVECNQKDVKNYLPIDEDAHAYLEVVKKEATCTAEGTVFRLCKYDSSHCGDFKIEKVDHVYSDVWEIKEATCLLPGYKKNSCAICKEELVIELPVDKTAHQLEGQTWVTTKQALCGQYGEETTSCKRCTKLIVREIPQCLHDSAFVGRTEPTCYSDGADRYICIECGRENSITISKDTKAHTPSVGYKLGRAATCKEPGYETRVCINCNAEIEEKQRILPIKPHTIVEVYKEYPSCAPKDEDFKSGLKDQKCIVCDHVYENIPIEATHNFSSWSKPSGIPTCLAPVQRERVCYNCHLVDVDNNYYGEHVDGKWVFTVGSCLEGGVAIKNCSLCGQNYGTKLVEAGEHADLVLVKENLTPTETICYGNEYKCNTCDKTVIYTKSHNFMVLEKGFAPTCELPGLSDSKYCAMCKFKVEPVVIAPLTHSYVYDSDGTKFCTKCDRYFVEEGLAGSCDHFCHNNGIVAKVMKMVFGMFWKMFGTKHYCECGVAHYHEDAATIVSTKIDKNGKVTEIEYSCSECRGMTKTKKISFK